MRAKRGSIEGTTRVVGIFGDPVDHSLSPRMHNAAFHALDLDYVYVPLRPQARSIVEAVRAVRVLGLAGVNVTVPFKESVMRGLDRASDTAKAVRAVNTIYTDSAGKLVGENTDVSGFLAALKSAGFRPRGKQALLIGAGGAARAVAYALLEAGAADVLIVNRTLEKARAITRDFRRYRGRIHAAPLNALDDEELLGRSRLVVNSTSLGLHGSRFASYDSRHTPDDCVHFDLAYADKPTAFAAAAAKAGRPVVDGRAMLLYQGAAAFRLFTGRKAPVEVMARALGIKP